MAKKQENGILHFLTNSNTYMGNRSSQGAKSFVALPSVKRGNGKKKKELGLYLLPFKSIAEKPKFFEKINFIGL